ncbi:MAG: hypothetical protein WCS97_02565 [Candidatus Paceibacterota bacterium]|jgi:hypothetical protein
MILKSEIRNPKSETNFKYLNFKIFGFVSCFVLVISCLLLFVPHVFAQGFVPLAPIPGLTQGVMANEAGLANFFNNLYKYLIGIAAILAVIQIIRGGLEISTQDSISKQGEGREHIKQAILGLVLVLSPVLVFSIINPSILNLSLNLPALDTKTSATTPATNTTGAKTSPSGAKTTVSITPTYSPYQYCTSSGTCADLQRACTLKGGSKTPSSGIIVCLKKDGTEDPNGRADKKLFQSMACITNESLAVKCVTFQ